MDGRLHQFKMAEENEGLEFSKGLNDMLTTGSKQSTDAWNSLSNWGNDNPDYGLLDELIDSWAANGYNSVIKNGRLTWWTDMQSTGIQNQIQGVAGHAIKLKTQNVWDKTSEFFKDHFYAEGTLAVKQGFYASILLKNGFGATLGEYTEDRITYSTNNIYHLKSSNTQKVEAAAALEFGGGYSYDIDNNTNQITVGAYTFSAEITKDNIFVGWTPNINLGIGVGGEAGVKIGFNFPTSGWFNYDKW